MFRIIFLPKAQFMWISILSLFPLSKISPRWKRYSYSKSFNNKFSLYLWAQVRPVCTVYCTQPFIFIYSFPALVSQYKCQNRFIFHNNLFTWEFLRTENIVIFSFWSQYITVFEHCPNIYDCTVGWCDFKEKIWTNVMLCQIVYRTLNFKFHFDMLLLTWLRASENFDYKLKISKKSFI